MSIVERKTKAYKAYQFLAQVIESTYPSLRGKTLAEIGARLTPTRHTRDFRSVRWHGKDYTFSPGQAAIVAVLWEEWERGTPKVGAGPLLHAADLVSDKVSVLFRDHEAWGVMIKTNGAGVYWLES